MPTSYLPVPPMCGIAVFMKEACYVRGTCCSQKRVLRQLDHSAREASIEIKETTQIPSFVRSLQQTTSSLVSKRVEVCRTFDMGPKTEGLKKVSLQTCFLFWIAATTPHCQIRLQACISSRPVNGCYSQQQIRKLPIFIHYNIQSS
jgi:hypothetical protein